MRLYLVQHGEAKTREQDPDRPLTGKGESDVDRIAALLMRAKICVGAVWHSGKTRAAQTAEILCSSLASTEGIVVHEGLDPNDPIDPVQRELIGAPADIMIVGHLPFLGKLVSALLVGDETVELVTFQNGGAVCLERNEEKGRWRLTWAVVPELLGAR